MTDVREVTQEEWDLAWATTYVPEYDYALYSRMPTALTPSWFWDYMDGLTYVSVLRDDGTRIMLAKGDAAKWFRPLPQ